VPSHSTSPGRSTEPAHSAEPTHPTEPVHSAAGERATVKARPHWRTEAVVVPLVEVTKAAEVIEAIDATEATEAIEATEVIEVMEVMEAMEVVETIDKDEAHAPADEKRRPPIPRIGIRVGREQVPKSATIRALHDLPRSVTLQTRTPDDLLHRAVDFCLPEDRTAIGAVGRHRQTVIHLRRDERRKAETDETGPETK
jgi:hypothetical protein